MTDHRVGSRVAMLAAHGPEQDPRVEWVAQSLLARGYDPVLIGFALDRPTGRSIEAGVETFRIVRDWPHSKAFMARLRATLPEFAEIVDDHVARLTLRAKARNTVAPARFSAQVAAFEQLPTSQRLKARARTMLVNRGAVGMSALRALQQYRSVAGGVARRFAGLRATDGKRDLHAPESDSCASVDHVAPATEDDGDNPPGFALEAEKDHQHAWMLVHMLSAAECLLEQLERLEAVDFVHCHDLETLLAGVLYKLDHGDTAVFWDSHENWPLMDPAASAWQTECFLGLERVLASHADHAFAVSPQLCSAIEARTSLPGVTCLPNAEPWRAGRVASQRTKMSALAAGRVKILFQGAFAANRGLEDILLALDKHDSEHFSFYFRGHHNQQRDHLVALARELGLLDHMVYFLDPVREEELVAASSEADIGLIPYLKKWPAYEVACPNKLSQYLHGRVAVLSNDLPFVRSIVEGGNCGVIYDSTKQNSLSEALGLIKSDPGIIETWRTNALKTAEDSFNWQVVSQAMLARYDDYRQ